MGKTAQSYSHLAHANDLEPSIGHRHLLEHCPVHREDSYDPPFYVVSRYEEVFGIVTEPDAWNNGDGNGVFYADRGVLGASDGEDHRRQRKVLQGWFRPSAIESLGARIDRIGEQLWHEAFAGDGEGDFVDLFASAFPAIVIAELLGVPSDAREQFGAWSNDIVNGLGGGDLALVAAANAHIFALVDDIVEQRLRLIQAGAPLPDDLISEMTRACLAGTLSREEVRRLCQQLLVAGHETTASLISLMLYRLIQHPQLIDQLRHDPALIPAAVEEFLRFDSPVQGLFRTNAAASTVAATEIPERAKVLVLFAAANRDPDIWEAPDEIRFDRAAGRPHLALGWGVHHCIGAPLARREGQLALRLMIESFESIELVGPVAVNTPFILRGLTTLPIRWRVRRGSAHVVD